MKAALPLPPAPVASIQDWVQGMGKRVGLPRVRGSQPQSQPGLGPEGLAAGGARGPCLGAEPNSIPQQPPARRRPVSNSSPSVTGSRGGAQCAPAPPHLSGLTWPLHPPDPVPTGSPGSPEVGGRRWERTLESRIENRGHRRGAETGSSEFVDWRSRELGGLAEGGRERARAGREGQGRSQPWPQPLSVQMWGPGWLSCRVWDPQIVSLLMDGSSASDKAPR